MTIHQDPELVMTLQSVIEFIGTFAFALSGIRLAASKHYDWLGGFVCGVAVAIGGGTIRDVMLGLNPFWMSSPIYLLFTFLAQLVVIVCHHYLKRLDNTWFLFDTLGLALFNIAGIQKLGSGSCGYSGELYIHAKALCDLLSQADLQSGIFTGQCILETKADYCILNTDS